MMIVAFVCCFISIEAHFRWTLHPKYIIKFFMDIPLHCFLLHLFLCCNLGKQSFKYNGFLWNSFIKRCPRVKVKLAWLRIDFLPKLTVITKGWFTLSPHIYTSSVDSSALFQLLSPKSTTPGSKCVLAYSLRIHCWFSNIISILFIITVKHHQSPYSSTSGGWRFNRNNIDPIRN